MNEQQTNQFEAQAKLILKNRPIPETLNTDSKKIWEPAATIDTKENLSVEEKEQSMGGVPREAALKKHNKLELQSICNDLNVDFVEDDTKTVLIQKILGA